jgi:hypothetical protein
MIGPLSARAHGRAPVHTLRPPPAVPDRMGGADVFVAQASAVLRRRRTGRRRRRAGARSHTPTALLRAARARADSGRGESVSGPQGTERRREEREPLLTSMPSMNSHVTSRVKPHAAAPCTRASRDQRPSGVPRR